MKHGGGTRCDVENNNNESFRIIEDLTFVSRLIKLLFFSDCFLLICCVSLSTIFNFARTNGFF